MYWIIIYYYYGIGATPTRRRRCVVRYVGHTQSDRPRRRSVRRTIYDDEYTRSLTV